MKPITTSIALVLLWVTAVAFAQEQRASATTPISPSARLAAAKKAYLKNAGGSDIPFNVIESGLEGWGRFTLVDSPAHADVIIEVQAPEDDTGVSITSSTDNGGHTTTSSSRDLSVAIVRLTAYDARTHLPLWTAFEKPKGAFKEKAREDNLVKASEKLVSRFRDRLEPPPADGTPAGSKVK